MIQRAIDARKLYEEARTIEDHAAPILYRTIEYATKLISGEKDETVIKSKITSCAKHVGDEYIKALKKYQSSRGKLTLPDQEQLQELITESESRVTRGIEVMKGLEERVLGLTKEPSEIFMSEEEKE